jgi:hypothetical protein
VNYSALVWWWGDDKAIGWEIDVHIKMVHFIQISFQEEMSSEADSRFYLDFLSMGLSKKSRKLASPRKQSKKFVIWLILIS